MERRTISEKFPITASFLKCSQPTGVLPGRIGLTFAPGSPMKSRKGSSTNHIFCQRDLVKDLEHLKAYYKCDILISLLEKKEFESLHIEGLKENARKVGMQSIWYPIKNGKAPSSLTTFDHTVRCIVRQLNLGKAIIIHCKKGIGRSGLFAACCLLHYGLIPEDAINAAREVRQGAVENRLQEDFVTLYYKRCILGE